jgi:hypothetical protein
MLDEAPSGAGAVHEHDRELGREDAPARRRRRPVADWGGDEVFARAAPRRRFGDEARPDAAPAGPSVGSGPQGTLVPSAHRRRAPRALHERVGPRPERIAAWAFALGVVLVLVAVVTASAATSPGDRTLKRGMHGRDVRHLQLRLIHGGFLHAHATGAFRPLTRARSGPISDRAV